MKRDSRGNVIQPATPVLNKTLPSASSSASASASAAAAAATEDLRTGEYEQEMKRRRLGKTTIVKDIYNQLCECFKRCYERFFQKELPSASSSSSASASAAVATEDLPIGEYEVFLSFRGADTRTGFTDFLYTYLHGAGVRTFRDDNELRVGEEIGPELLRAIKGSKISIPIFSKGYASSKWCLRELAQMVECRANSGQIIYPIFYDVEPSEVQHYKRGSYKEAFLQYEKSKSLVEATVQQWKAALEIVGELKGLELKKETNGHEGQLVKKIVEMVLLKLEKNYTPVPDSVVGMDEHIKEMDVKLNVDSNGVRIVGIHGMGGLGKTTIAKVIYNSHCQRFGQYCCFLDDVRENSQHDDIVNLQKQLLSKIQNLDIKDIKIRNKYEGIKKIKDAIHGKKVFIVLDDVEEKSQYDLLVGSSDWFASGSRIIVTTRNKLVLDLLKEVNVQKGLPAVFEFYEPPFMKFDVSLQLFSKCAFMRDYPNEGYSSLAKKFVSVAAGLPLVLVTIGSLLFIEKDKDLWEAKLRELQEIPSEDVQHRLKISFNALTLEQRKIFLDIACFFIGCDKIYPCYMWDDCRFHPSWALNVLVQRSLIKIGDDNTFKMHDQLRGLGRYIVREGNLGNPGRLSRLWNEDEALAVYESGQGTEEVEALSLEFSNNILVGEKFVRLPNLRYLTMKGVYFYRDFEHCLPNLRWLQWIGWSMGFTENNFHLRNLIILHLSSSDITENSNLWTQLKMSRRLKVLHLESCSSLQRVPSLSTFSNLERLVLDSCYNLRSLDAIEELESLKYLDATGCWYLETRPNLSRLRKLEKLNVSKCTKIKEILGLDKLESLEVLYMNECIALVRLPDLSNLKRLKELNATSCRALIEIQGLDRLDSLEYLVLDCCVSIKRLPDLSNLKKLKILNASNCNKLIEIQGLPDRLGSLDVLDCRSLERLPDLSNLKRLKELNASCTRLTEIRGLGGLESLEVLDMIQCIDIERLFDLSNLKSLRKLDIGCPKLIEIPSLEGLESLEHLLINKCESIERLPDLSNLKSLKTLNVLSCVTLIEIQGLQMLESLKSLKILKVSECVALIKIQGLHMLESLEHLEMRRCDSIERLPDLPSFGVLKKIDMSACENLRKVEGLGVAESLESLNLSYCKALGEIDLANLKNLKKLCIHSLPKLNEIRGLEELKSLEALFMNSCNSIEVLPDISNLMKLRKLQAAGCGKLTVILGLEEVKSLEYLDIGGCKSVDLLDFSNLKKLVVINASECEKLTEIRGLDKLESLGALFIRGCDSLKNLPHLQHSRIHKDYNDFDLQTYLWDPHQRYFRKN